MRETRAPYHILGLRPGGDGECVMDCTNGGRFSQSVPKDSIHVQALLIHRVLYALLIDYSESAVHRVLYALVMECS